MKNVKLLYPFFNKEQTNLKITTPDHIWTSDLWIPAQSVIYSPPPYWQSNRQDLLCVKEPLEKCLRVRLRKLGHCAGKRVCRDSVQSLSRRGGFSKYSPGVRRVFELGILINKQEIPIGNYLYFGCKSQTIPTQISILNHVWNSMKWCILDTQRNTS